MSSEQEAAYRHRHHELIARLEAAGHEPVVKSVRHITPHGSRHGEVVMYCARCRREADRVLFRRLTPNRRCGS